MDLTAGCVKAILEKYADPIGKKIGKLAKDEWEKFKIDFDLVFINYLKNSYEKYSKIKTILYRTEPKYIYNFFECPTIKVGYNIIDGNDINNILSISNFLIIQGTGGIGKSMFLKHLFLNELSKKDFIPIFIELKDLNDIKDDYDIKDFIFEKLDALGSTIKKNHLEYALKSGCFLFLLDGYDEIITEKRDEFFKKFDGFCDKYSDNYFIVTSRPYSEFVEFQRFTILSICELSKEQAVSLISKIDFDYDIKSRFINSLEENLYERHTSFASNPLLLNIMLLTFDNYAEIPEKLHLFYSNAFETLYSKHDATKSGYKRELKSTLSYDSFKKVFSYFCFMTYYQGKIEFSYEDLYNTLKKISISGISFDVRDYIYDLVSSICVLYKEGLNYKFAHRSFQEYFTSIFLKELSDKNMTQMGLTLIKKDTYRATHDSVFPMLFDMTEERVEQNILLPLLEEIEHECDLLDKYDFYFSKFKPICEFVNTSDGETGLWLRSQTGDEIVEFIGDYIRFYSNYDRDSVKIMKEKSQSLLDYLIETINYEIGTEIQCMNFIDNKTFYSLLKSTWVGTHIETTANLRKILSEKKKEKELDLSSLLS